MSGEQWGKIGTVELHGRVNRERLSDLLGESVKLTENKITGELRLETNDVEAVIEGEN
jgi:hypothetical protein